MDNNLMADTTVPNLDAMSVAELLEFIQILHILRDYATYKCAAIQSRQQGRVDIALNYERQADRKYKELPASIRW